MSNINKTLSNTNGKITIKLVKSGCGRSQKQQQTLIGLKLNKMWQEVTLDLTPEIAGMVQKVKHLLEIKETL